MESTEKARYKPLRPVMHLNKCEIVCLFTMHNSTFNITNYLMLTLILISEQKYVSIWHGENHSD